MEENILEQASNEGLDKLAASVNRIKSELGKIIVGQDSMIEMMIVGIFSGGHILMEGIPGVGKTLTAKLLANAFNISFSRIQFTPDLLPSDVIGTTVFNLKTSEFDFKKGPVFANIVLVDEINRSPAKTQAALFEVMEEGQVTIDGMTHKLGAPFFVIATQNPIDQEGTYKLPEAQLDRFIFKIIVNYPSLQEEIGILNRYKSDFDLNLLHSAKAVLNAEDIAQCKKSIQEIYIKEELINYIATLINNTRNNSSVYVGASPRASLAVLKTSKALAAISGRNFVTPQDIQTVLYPVLTHRLILTPEKEMEGLTTMDVIKEIIESVEVPR